VIQSICLLGSFRVYADSPVKIPKKGEALLALLAIAALDGEGMSRERLSRILWPYQDSEHAYHSLRNCLGELRKALRTEAVNLITDFVSCRLDMPTDVADFGRLEHCGTQRDLEAAEELYRGDLLDNFATISDSFEEWLRNERDLWQQRAMAVLSRLAATATNNADHGTSIRAARRMVHIEPWNEDGQRLLIGALHASGQRGEAALQWRRCRETLKQELGIDPAPETSRLAHRLFTVESSPPANAAQAIWAVEPVGVEPQDEVLLRRAMKMLDEAREEIRDNLDHSASIMEALRLDRELFTKVLLRLEHHMTTKHVGMRSLETMSDAIRRRLGDEYLAAAPRARAQSNGEVGAELVA
jgi:DNA-binding SARP family transcriptional activator